MSDSLWQWPALQGDRGRLPERLECQRGVFGKVQGARSDFRWIARSAGFPGGDELEKAIALGSSGAACPAWARRFAILPVSPIPAGRKTLQDAAAFWKSKSRS